MQLSLCTITATFFRMNEVSQQQKRTIHSHFLIFFLSPSPWTKKPTYDKVKSTPSSLLSVSPPDDDHDHDHDNIYRRCLNLPRSNCLIYFKIHLIGSLTIRQIVFVSHFQNHFCSSPFFVAIFSVMLINRF